MAPIKVLIAEDQTLLRQGLCRIIEHESDFTVVGDACDGEALLAAVDREAPNLILMSLRLPGMDGSQLITMLRQRSSGIKIVALSDQCTDEDALRTLKAGARGYLPKDINSATLIKCLRVVHAGQVWAESRITARLLDEYSSMVRGNEQSAPSMDGHLTEREYEVLRMVAQGYSNREAARMLYISEKTVKTHLSNIFEKIRVSDRLQAALYAIRHRIVEF